MNKLTEIIAVAGIVAGNLGLIGGGYAIGKHYSPQHKEVRMKLSFEQRTEQVNCVRIQYDNNVEVECAVSKYR